jgi:hypothetical protein
MNNSNAKNLYIILPIIALALTGCGKSISQMASEKIAEKAIEAGTGGKAKVDVNNKGVKMETKDGNIETGDDVKSPANFPSDVFVIDGKIKAAIVDTASDNFSLTIETDKSMSNASVLYQDKLKADGWKITGTMNFGESASVIAEKDTRNISVMFTKSDTKTMVIISLGKK